MDTVLHMWSEQKICPIGPPHGPYGQIQFYISAFPWYLLY